MKLKTFVFVAIVSMTLVSCTKTRNCRCTEVEDDGEYSEPPIISNQALGGDPLSGMGGKKNQETMCKSFEYSDGYSTKTCKLTN